MLQKGVYTYEYMDDWQKLNETLILEKKQFCSHLNMEDITQPARNILEIFPECSLSLAMFWASREHLGNMFKENSF